MSRYRIISTATLLLLIIASGCEDNPTSVSSPRYSELSDSSFAVGDSSNLEVVNFAGNMVVLLGNPGVVRIVATKWARQPRDLDQLEVEMVEQQNGVRVTTANPSALLNVWVDLEITVPEDTRPRLESGAGNTRYRGLAEGESRFALGAGSITLELPANVNVRVDLSVGAGSIDVNFPVAGQVREHIVEGIIGTGADGRIEAQVGSGRIIVNRQ